MRIITALLVVFISLLTACDQSAPASNDPTSGNASELNIANIAPTLPGKTVGHLLDILNLDSTNYIKLQEPPGILRGLSIKRDSTEILLYVKRTSDFDRNITIEEIRQMPITGLSWRFGRLCGREGEIIIYYDFEYFRPCYQEPVAVKKNVIDPSMLRGKWHQNKWVAFHTLHFSDNAVFCENSGDTVFTLNYRIIADSIETEHPHFPGKHKRKIKKLTRDELILEGFHDNENELIYSRKKQKWNTED